MQGAEEYIDPANTSQIVNPGPDISSDGANYSPSDVDPSVNVYDWDAPGPLQLELPVSSGGSPLGTQARNRANISEYAIRFELSNSETETPVGTALPIFSRESCLKLALGSGSQLDTTYDANGDN